MTLPTKNGGYAYLIRLDLMFSIITDIKSPIKHLIKLILYENDVKLLIYKRSPVYVNLWYV